MATEPASDPSGSTDEETRRSPGPNRPLPRVYLLRDPCRLLAVGGGLVIALVLVVCLLAAITSGSVTRVAILVAVVVAFAWALTPLRRWTTLTGRDGLVEDIRAQAVTCGAVLQSNDAPVCAGTETSDRSSPSCETDP